jgi:flagellar biosynthesis anti-sigma factor FlgM
MKITDSNLNGVSTPAQQSGQVSGGGSAGRGTAASRAEFRDDRVQLSDLSSTLKSLSADSPERQEKVARLAETYNAGRYQVQPQQISQGIIADAFSAS